MPQIKHTMTPEQIVEWEEKVRSGTLFNERSQGRSLQTRKRPSKRDTMVEQEKAKLRAIREAKMKEMGW